MKYLNSQLLSINYDKKKVSHISKDLERCLKFENLNNEEEFSQKNEKTNDNSFYSIKNLSNSSYIKCNSPPCFEEPIKKNNKIFESSNSPKKKIFNNDLHERIEEKPLQNRFSPTNNAIFKNQVFAPGYFEFGKK